MFTKLRNEVNHLLYLYFNSVGVIQRDYDREGIETQVQEMCSEIRSSKDRIYSHLDKLLRKTAEPSAVEDVPDRTVLEDGLEFVDWCIRSSLGLEGCLDATETQK